LPGLGDFVGEFLVMIGTYKAHLIGLTLVAAIGVLISTIYGLKFIDRAFQGQNSNRWSVRDLTPREVVMLIPMVAILIWLGIYPQPVFNTYNQSRVATFNSAGMAGTLTSPSPLPNSLRERGRTAQILGDKR